MSWWPSSLHPVGFVAHQASLGTNGPSFGKKESLPKSRGEKLISVMERVNVGQLAAEDAEVFRKIDKEHPWLLTQRELELLKRLSSHGELLRVLLDRTKKQA